MNNKFGNIYERCVCVFLLMCVLLFLFSHSAVSNSVEPHGLQTAAH